MLRLPFQFFIDFLYPSLCAACMEPICVEGALCPTCWRQVAWIEPPYCEQLGVPFAHDWGGEMICAEAVVHPPEYGRARAVARFDEGPIRQLVHRLKYGDRLEIAPILANWMVRAGKELIRDADLILPVPMPRWRLLKRSYNQAALLSQHISKLTRVPNSPFLLNRCASTPPQVGLTRVQREKNLRGAFEIKPAHVSQIEGRRILLIDDVLTTGATVNAAARTLMKAKAKQVDVLVVAIVVRGE